MLWGAWSLARFLRVWLSVAARRASVPASLRPVLFWPHRFRFCFVGCWGTVRVCAQFRCLFLLRRCGSACVFPAQGLTLRSRGTAQKRAAPQLHVRVLLCRSAVAGCYCLGLRQSASVLRCSDLVIRLHRATCALVGTAKLAGCGAVQAGVQRGGRYGFFR